MPNRACVAQSRAQAIYPVGIGFSRDWPLMRIHEVHSSVLGSMRHWRLITHNFVICPLSRFWHFHRCRGIDGDARKVNCFLGTLVAHIEIEIDFIWHYLIA